MEGEMGSKKIKIYAGAGSMATSAGLSPGENFARVLAGGSGCAPTDKGFPLGLIDREAFPAPPGTKGCTFLERMLIRTIGEVIRQSEVSLADKRCLVIISSTKGNIEYLTGEDREPDGRIYLWSLAEKVGGYFAAANMPLVISNACISGLSAVITASRLIRWGDYDHIIVAGGDTVTDFVISGFASFKSLSTAICRPYDASRDGLTLGEGCGALLLTRDKALAGEFAVEIAGGAVSNDANHISGPSRTGEGLWYAIRDAIWQSGLPTEQIDFINGHGTATVYNDEMESRALALAGLENTPLNSLKPLFGHTLGAAGIVELIMCIEQMRRGVILGTPGFTSCGTPVGLNVTAENRKQEIDACLKTASGFGGCNAAVVLARAGMAPGPTAKGKVPATVTSRIDIEYTGSDFGGYIREQYKLLGESNMKFYKMDDLCKLGYIGAARLLKNRDIAAKYSPDEVGIILYGNSSSIDSDRSHVLSVGQSPEGAASPSVFVYTLANLVAGEICIRHRLQGENTCFVFRGGDDGFTENYGRRIVENGYLKAVVCGYCELAGGKGSVRLQLIEPKTQIYGETDARAQGAPYRSAEP
ncbi:MAG: beta-ACP synthase [Rikenellaceae bacterium]|nr:beta-ACP synthase [Rikenellaceae bacterium]